MAAARLPIAHPGGPPVAPPSRPSLCNAIITHGTAPKRPVSLIPAANHSAFGSQHAYLLSEDARRLDWEVIAVLLTAAVRLTVGYYAFAGGRSIEWLLEPARLGAEFARRAHWAILQIVGYAAIPILIVQLIPGRGLRDYGIGLRLALPMDNG